MKVIAEYYVDCGRMGSLQGLFVTTRRELDRGYGKTLYWGEVLGKHSEVIEEFRKDAITIRSEDQEFIAKLCEVLDISSEGTISGLNPISQLYEQGDLTEDDEIAPQ